MSQNKENNKTRRGFYTSQLKRVVINRYKEFIKVVPKLKEQDVISDISRLIKRSPTTIGRIINNGCVSPKKTKYLNLDLTITIVIMTKLIRL
jgi:hypothetical protein